MFCRIINPIQFNYTKNPQMARNLLAALPRHGKGERTVKPFPLLDKCRHWIPRHLGIFGVVELHRINNSRICLLIFHTNFQKRVKTDGRHDHPTRSSWPKMFLNKYNREKSTYFFKQLQTKNGMPVRVNFYSPPEQRVSSC